MKHLWAPWRMEYIRRKKQSDKKGCVFCNKSKEKHNDKDNLVLFRGKESFVLMNLYPYNNGHLMVTPYKHVNSIQLLSQSCMNEIMKLSDRSMRIIKKTLKSEGFNFGANIGKAGGAGIEDHIHFHIVPRWIGDTNFMPVIGQTKVMVGGLTETYDELQSNFDKLR